MKQTINYIANQDPKRLNDTQASLYPPRRFVVDISLYDDLRAAAIELPGAQTDIRGNYRISYLFFDSGNMALVHAASSINRPLEQIVAPSTVRSNLEVQTNVLKVQVLGKRIPAPLAEIIDKYKFEKMRDKP
ncbi:hypothetical protein J4444_05295 [Candidatus Woesearchaeota archaeon]|nr:hypothetical protein [Candidatus Woesearchaeota archaeon]